MPRVVWCYLHDARRLVRVVCCVCIAVFHVLCVVLCMPCCVWWAAYDVCRGLCVVYCVAFVVCCMLRCACVVCCVVYGVGYVLVGVWCLLFVVCSMLHVVHRMLFDADDVLVGF